MISDEQTGSSEALSAVPETVPRSVFDEAVGTRQQVKGRLRECQAREEEIKAEFKAESGQEPEAEWHLFQAQRQAWSEEQAGLREAEAAQSLAEHAEQMAGLTADVERLKALESAQNIAASWRPLGAECPDPLALRFIVDATHNYAPIDDSEESHKRLMGLVLEDLITH